jgi:hypothetical protein
MERIWTFGSSAVSVLGVDFLDPALADEPDARERGVRLEVRPLGTHRVGSVYASPTLTLAPALVRVDLLESAPFAADRMHWHPQMSGGEPGDRTFDPSLSRDPGAWLSTFLGDLEPVLRRAHPDEVIDAMADDLVAIAAVRGEIIEVAMTVLTVAREPWPEVTHDPRGLASL